MMTEYSVRAATGQDADAIAYVHVESWRTTYTGIVPDSYLASLDEGERAHRWREWLSRDGTHVFVAELKGEMVGFVSGGAIREPLDDYDAELFTIYLLRRVQGWGIGTALLRVLARSLVAMGLTSMAVWVLENNSSTNFYKKSGALLVSSKEIDIGSAMLPVIAYGWPDLQAVASAS